MPDEDLPAHDAATGHGEHAEIHMPPNSFVPICVALSLAVTLVGFVDQVRNTVGPTVWLIGLIGVVASCVVWYFAARTEYGELPESLDSH